MLDPDVSKYAALLKGQYLFQGLNDAQLAHIITRFDRLEVASQATVYSQGDKGDSFYVIYQGRVQVTHMDGNRERTLRILTIGEHFGEDALLFDRLRGESVTAIEPCVFLVLTREEFYELLEMAPGIRMNLSATAESRYIAQKENFDWLGEDEIIYLISRKHEFFLFVSLIYPLLLGMVSIPVIVLSLSAESPFISTAGSLAGILGLVGSGVWGVWNWIDWGNDFYIVTSQRVVWLERVIVLYYSRQEAPLHQVLSVNTTTSFLGRILNYGTVDVRTYTGGIPMRKIADPKRFASFVEAYRSRTYRQLKEAEKQTIESDLRKRLQMDHKPDPMPVFEKKMEDQKPEKDKVKAGSLRDILDTFLKVRFERDGVITYRKHWLVLIGKIWLPSLAFLALTGFFIYVLYVYLFTQGRVLGFSGLTLTLLVGLAYLGVILWGGYHYLDWNNDIYQLAPEQILDIERKPLGEEQKKTAPLDSILSLEHYREGIIQLIFNYGDVIINVGQAKFIFRGVYNPDRVHQDVADFIEARRRRRQEADALRERQRMLDWFDTYQDQQEEIEESKKESDWDLFPG